jgi:putative transposase
MAKEGLSIQISCRVLDVSQSGFFAWRSRAPSLMAVRHMWLTEVITEIHRASRGTYGALRVHAELHLGRGIRIGHNTVELLMQRAGLRGLPGARGKRLVSHEPTAEDLVDRRFTREGPNQLWVTDITQHRTREGHLFCCVVLDAFSRRVVGWSIDSAPDAALVTSALAMAVKNRSPKAGTVIHSDHGTQFCSWVFTRRVQESGLVPSMGSVGDCFDNAIMEAFWARMQTELLNRRRWRTRLELSNAIFEYLEIFYNRQRRHSSLGMRSPIEYERLKAEESVA